MNENNVEKESENGRELRVWGNKVIMTEDT